jgi:hypothetical protein
LLLALALELDDAVLAVGLEVTDLDFGQLLDAAGGKGKDGEQGPVAEPGGGVGRGGVEELAAVAGCQANGLALAGAKSGWAGLAPLKP